MQFECWIIACALHQRYSSCFTCGNTTPLQGERTKPLVDLVRVTRQHDLLDDEPIRVDGEQRALAGNAHLTHRYCNEYKASHRTPVSAQRYRQSARPTSASNHERQPRPMSQIQHERTGSLQHQHRHGWHSDITIDTRHTERLRMQEPLKLVFVRVHVVLRVDGLGAHAAESHLEYHRLLHT